MNTAVCCMYDDLEALNVDVVDVKLKNNFAIAFFDNFLVIDRSKCKTAAQERTVLAHEAGHYMSGAFYRAYSPFEVKEQRASGICRICRKVSPCQRNPELLQDGHDRKLGDCRIFQP